MLFEHAYKGATSVANDARATSLSFAPDLHRQPTFFHGVLREAIPFREAVSALHDVVVSDLRFKPKEREAYKAWAKEREERDVEAVAAERQEVKAQIARLRTELEDLTRRSSKRMEGYFRAKRRYFDYLYQKDRDAWFVLDPIVTVHPDEIFFECFSQDESTYGRLSADYQVFDQVGERANGTTIYQPSSPANLSSNGRLEGRQLHQCYPLGIRGVDTSVARGCDCWAEWFQFRDNFGLPKLKASPRLDTAC